MIDPTRRPLQSVGFYDESYVAFLAASHVNGILTRTTIRQSDEAAAHGAQKRKNNASPAPEGETVTRDPAPLPDNSLWETNTQEIHQEAEETSASASLPIPRTEEAAHQLQRFQEAQKETATTKAGESGQDARPSDEVVSPDQEQEFPVRDLVTLVKVWRLTNTQRADLIIPTPLCILATRNDRKEVIYSAGIITERNPETGKQRTIQRFGERTPDAEQAYRNIEEGVKTHGLTLADLQPITIPEQKPEPAPTAEEIQKNPLLALLKEDEIYVDPSEVTIEEAEENGYPLLRRDVVTYRWWLEFPFDTREQPALHQALKDTKWRWGGYRQQWHNASHFPDLPKDMYYANAGPAFYSEENAERIEARATKARDKSSTHFARSDQLASVIPFGQPMMPGHYSYRSDLSYRKKIWRQMDLFVEFYKKAEWLENRADSSRRLQRRKTRVSSMQNRIDTLSATLRSVRRDYEEAKSKGATYLDSYRKRLTILAQEIIPLQSAIAERGGLPIEQVEKGERPLQPGDYIQIRGQAMYVVKVNAKTIKVADPKVHDANGHMWELTYKKSDFQRLLATKEEVEAIKAKHQERQD